jgi:hypothetical protein
MLPPVARSEPLTATEVEIAGDVPHKEAMQRSIEKKEDLHRTVS